jgi:thioredoxin-like negative regulator of GroEL
MEIPRGMVLVQVWAMWNAREDAPMRQALEGLTRRYGRLQLLFCDADEVDNHPWLVRHGVDKLPALLGFWNGQRVFSRQWSLREEDLEDLLLDSFPALREGLEA